MKMSKSTKSSSIKAVTSSSVDTSLWEQLLSGRDARNTSAPADAAPAPGTAGAVRSRPIALETGKVAPRSDRLPKKKHKAAVSNTELVGSLFKTVGSNWDLLAGSSAANGNGAPAALISNGQTSTDKRKRNKAKQGNTRPRSEIGMATTTPNFFSAKRSSDDKWPRTTAGVCGAVGGGIVFKKRKRTDAGGVGSSTATAAGTNVKFSTHGTGSKQQKHPNTNNNSKRPRSNILNLAFQAQKEEAAAAATVAGGAIAKREGGGKGQGRRGGSEQALTAAEKAQYVAMDCEMVGVGPSGRRSALARCCLVDWEGNTIYDKHVTPNERVTDFRTFVSGVKASHLKNGLHLRQCQEEVAAILKGKILVGHALHNDLKALMMSHPPRATRDTATYRPYQKAHAQAGGKLRARSLKVLSQEKLDRCIQEGRHNPAEDAKAAMDLYKLAWFEWEKSLSAAGKKRKRLRIVDQCGP